MRRPLVNQFGTRRRDPRTGTDWLRRFLAKKPWGGGTLFSLEHSLTGQRPAWKLEEVVEEVDLVSTVDTAATNRSGRLRTSGPKIRRKRRKPPDRKLAEGGAGAPAAQVAPPDAQRDQAALHVLLIEDQPTVAESLKRQLEAEGIRVDIAGDGETGLTMARRLAYDAILVDRRLPKMSGDQVLERLRQDGDRTPVLILTGYPDIESAFRAGRLHAAEYLRKGTLTAVELAAAVRRAVSTNPRAAQQVALFATQIVGASPCIREVRACLERLAVLPAAGAEQADEWRRTLAGVLVRAAASRHLTFPEFTACARSLLFLHSSVRPPLDAAVRRMDAWFADAIRRSSFPPHTRAQSVVARIEATGSRWSGLSEQQIAQEENVTVADTARWLDECAGVSFLECRRLVVTRQVALRLAETTDQVKRIAFTVGYRHESRLDREFEATVGLTPTEFRRLHQQNNGARHQ